MSTNSVCGGVKASQLAAKDARDFNEDINSVDQATVATAFGVKSGRVENPEEQDCTMTQAIADGGPTQPIIIIGAGIVGISTAIWLRRAGKNVLVLDRAEVGMGTSYGNGGVLAACGMVPVTSPGLGAKGPKLLLDKNFPLFLRWSYLPRLYPWLRKYLSHANDADTRRIAKGLTEITGDSIEQH